jgi:hypothetical protein
VHAECTDDDPAGCSSITLTLPNDTVLLSGSSSIDGVISLAQYEGGSVNLSFVGTDSVGQRQTVERLVYVDSSVLLTEAAVASGHIIDAQSSRLLSLDSTLATPVLKIRDRLTGQDTLVPSPPDQVPETSAFLTPKGAIFVARSVVNYLWSVYDWRDAQLINLGSADPSSLAVQGSYALWSVGSQLVRRDLTAGTNLIVSQSAGNIFNDVVANGDVVYWTDNSSSNYNIYRYSDGVSTALTSDTTLWNVYPITDGVSVVYQKITLPNQTYALAMYGAAGEETLAPARLGHPYPGPDYQANNSWIAFTQSGTGSLQVWTRSPKGARTQVSFFGSNSSIGALGPNGELTFTANGRTYLTHGSPPPTDVASSLGRGYWLDGQLYLAIGNTMFKVNALIKKGVAK